MFPAPFPYLPWHRVYADLDHCICPVTHTPFLFAWSLNNRDDSCDQCCPDVDVPLAQRLNELTRQMDSPYFDQYTPDPGDPLL